MVTKKLNYAEFWYWPTLILGGLFWSFIPPHDSMWRMPWWYTLFIVGFMSVVGLSIAAMDQPTTARSMIRATVWKALDCDKPRMFTPLLLAAAMSYIIWRSDPTGMWVAGLIFYICILWKMADAAWGVSAKKHPWFRIAIMTEIGLVIALLLIYLAIVDLRLFFEFLTRVISGF